MSKPIFSIIAPIYNEVDNLPVLYSRVSEVMNGTEEAWELILVDDGSKDGSNEVIRKLASADERVRPVIFARNFGHQIAVTAGLDYSRGDAVIIIDADLQDPPEVIHDLIAKWREGYDIVCAQRTARHEESAFKRASAYLFSRIMTVLVGWNLPADTGNFRLMNRAAVEAFFGRRGDDDPSATHAPPRRSATPAAGAR